MVGVLFTIGDTNVYEQDLKSFEPGQWLTDNAISFALEYITSACEEPNREQKHIVYPCFTEALKHCSVEEVPIFLGNPEDLINKTLLVIVSDNTDPNEILGGHHWTLLMWHDDSKCFYFFDSMNGRYHNFVPKIARRIAEHMYGKGFQYTIDIKNGTQQENASDCGMHVIELCRTLMNSSIEEISNLKLDTNTLTEKRKNWIAIGHTLTNQELKKE
ncbi:unnamed protein product [Auanema sp. JU1783]|nr:unnamed protein product [Auanema sp. JU1783]